MIETELPLFSSPDPSISYPGHDFQISAYLRTRKRLVVDTIVRKVIPLLSSQEELLLPEKVDYCAIQNRTENSITFNRSASTRMVNLLSGEPRVWANFYYKRGEDPQISFSFVLRINSSGDAVRRKIDGKFVYIPRESDQSAIFIHISSRFFLQHEFPLAFVNLCQTAFEIIEGEYGWAEHEKILHLRNNANEFDRIHRSLFEPSFVTWANFFGPAWVSQLGSAQVFATPAYQVRQLANGGVAILTSVNPLEQLKPETQNVLRCTKTHLGIFSPSERASSNEIAAFEERRIADQVEMQRRISEAFRQAREETATIMRNQAEECIAGIQRFWGLKAGYTLDALVMLDEIIEQKFQPDEDDETIETAVQAFGAYLGEVIRQNAGGIWHDEEMQGQPVLQKIGQSQKRIDPFEVVHLRFQSRSEKSGIKLVDWYERFVQT